MKPGRSLAKSCHVLFGAAWLSAAVVLLLVVVLGRAGDDRRLHALLRTARLLDNVVVIPAAAGTCLTALLLSLRRWKQPWIQVSWAIIVVAVLFGVFALAPALESLLAAVDPGAAARPWVYLLAGAPLQVGAMVLVGVLCVRRPWSHGR